jgi:hypothetical protein
MTSIISLTSHPVDTIIKVKIRAQNLNGWGDYSEINLSGALIETLPSTLNTPTFNMASSNAA